jgi:serine/threonine-protein kinase
MSRPRDYQPGEHVPGTVYRVIRLIGAGGMGTVYDVEDTTVGKRYVLKTLHPELHKRGDLAERMVKEARQLARVSHPNIVEVVTAGATTDDLKLPFYVMEKLNGQSLHTVLNKKGSLELPHALHIAIDLLDALENAHDKGVIHRDVKPDNIFLHINPNGQTTTKLLDFGIMRVLDEPGVTAGRFMGTLRYAAPEQLRGETPMPQTDLYAAALVLYEMIAGKGPFDDEGDANKIAAAHLTATPPSLMHWGAVVPEALERLVRTALSKDPLKRPKDAFTFASQLRNLNRALAAERPIVSLTSQPTVIPIVSPATNEAGTAPGNDQPTRKLLIDPVPASPLAPTEHAATRAGTPDAKLPTTSARVTAPRDTGPTATGMQAPSERPTLKDMSHGASASARPPSATQDPLTERAPAPVDRDAPTHSSTGPGFSAPRADGSTEPVPTAGSRVTSNERRPASTLRMSSAPPHEKESDDGGASDPLARLPTHESAVAPTDGAAASTVTPRVAGRVRPLVAVAIGLALTLATAATLWLVVGGIRSRLSAPEPQTATAAEPAATFTVAAPTIPPPLDLPPASAASIPATPSASSTPQPPQPPRPRSAPPPNVAPAAPPPPPPTTRRKLPGSGL